ncbi:uncharacterized protein BDR25DRAFT_379689 [Lindgomyces ingoldianus]|uniref:Uncharacterized protein n=1 Tax=Lindgomyces ingoldianus TaxID=673940 RepID=A0ACB6RA11_9PLEO|nr:uncharacterized protein BDR25DRAFT_379689 [Lindgomyces ingoldianus]KAF2476026.1 hypothetical protein BDR25DRAFT_379689 [Lindgomyces ingoldianus]
MAGPRDERTHFLYLKWSDLYNREKPFQLFLDIPKESPDQRKSNLVYEEGPEEIVHDVRGRESEFSIDNNGFTYIKHSTKLSSEQFEDHAAVEGCYLPECEKLLRKHLEGVDRVHFFDWRLRNNSLSKWYGKLVNLSDPAQPLPPEKHVHVEPRLTVTVDQAPDAVVRRVHLHLGDDAEYLLKGRVRTINVWKPLNGPIEDWPLAVCDGKTVKDENMIETDHIRRQYDGTTMYAQYSEGMKWYFMSQQQNDDVLLLKNFDSNSDVLARYAPHASFGLANEGAAPRQSIEVRALVFTYPKNC